MSATMEGVEIEEANAAGVALNTSAGDIEGEAAAVKPKGLRIHALDWLRSVNIYFAVYAHIWWALDDAIPDVVLDTRSYREYPADRPEYALLHQDTDKWRNDFSWRWIHIGRQLAIPMLFWISGASLAMTKRGNASLGTLGKVTAISIVGSLSNYAIAYFQLPPFGNGWFFIYQFWFTIFIMLFLLTGGLMIENFKKINEASLASAEFQTVPCGLKVGILVSFLLNAALHLLLSLWNDFEPPEVNTTICAAMVIGIEVLFTLALYVAVVVPPSYGRTCRVMQYVAAAISVVQYAVVPIQPPQVISMDGRTCIYFFWFKQCMVLGYVMFLTRSKASVVCSRYAILVFVVYVMFLPSTSWNLAGHLSYPWFQNTLDRVMWTGGGWIMMFMADRISIILAEGDMIEPLPAWLGFGSLLSYMLHPWGLVVFKMVPGMDDVAPLVTATIIQVAFSVLAVLIGCATSKKK